MLSQVACTRSAAKLTLPEADRFETKHEFQEATRLALSVPTNKAASVGACSSVGGCEAARCDSTAVSLPSPISIGSSVGDGGTYKGSEQNTEKCRDTAKGLMKDHASLDGRDLGHEVYVCVTSPNNLSSALPPDISTERLRQWRGPPRDATLLCNHAWSVMKEWDDSLLFGLQHVPNQHVVSLISPHMLQRIQRLPRPGQHELRELQVFSTSA